MRHPNMFIFSGGRDRLAKLLPMFALILAGSPVLKAAAIPLDITDTDPRFVTVSFETNGNPALLHTDLLPLVTGEWSVSGGVGTVDVSAQTMFNFVQSLGAGPVPGSFSPLLIQIDLGTRDVKVSFSGDITEGDFGVEHFAYQMQTQPGPWIVGSTIIPGTVGGFQDRGSYYNFASDAFHPFSDTSYTAVPTERYNASTGLLNAVGPDVVTTPDGSIYYYYDNSLGDLRLTETPEPSYLACNFLLICFAILARCFRKGRMTALPAPNPHSDKLV